MKKIKKILLLGGTGAMGVYLAPECVKLGYKVYITTRKKRSSTEENIQFIQGDAKDIDFFNKITMEYQFDAIVDFMIYTTNEFKQKIDILLNAASHYIFLSTYRVFADCGLDSITESSPKLLNVSTDDIYLKTDEYALTKAKQENLLLNSSYKNWTIVRPSITYSTNRFQLGVFEAEHFLSRALRSEYIPLPLELLNNQTTMTWGGDVGKMIALLILNKNSFGEDFNVVTSESVSWKSVADIYGDIIALKIKVVELKKFTLLVSNPWQLKYDRLFNRVCNNDKILEITGIKQSELMSVKEGLSLELKKTELLLNNHVNRFDGKVDRVLGVINLNFLKIPFKRSLLYWSGRSYFLDMAYHLFLKLKKVLIKNK